MVDKEGQAEVDLTMPRKGKQFTVPGAGSYEIVDFHPPTGLVTTRDTRSKIRDRYTYWPIDQIRRYL
jgi:hypothetical protein